MEEEEKEDMRNLRLLRKELGKNLLRIESLPVVQNYLFDFRNEKEKGKLINYINQNARLTKNTVLHSDYERMFANELPKHFDHILYEPLKLPVVLDEKKFGKTLRKLEDSSTSELEKAQILNFYVGDFWLPFNYINEKGIVIEPHCNRFINSNYIKKLGKIRENYGIYLILATMSDKYKDSMSLQEVRKEVDELWFISEDREGKLNLREQLVDLEKRSEIKPTSFLYSMLDKLHRNPIS